MHDPSADRPNPDIPLFDPWLAIAIASVCFVAVGVSVFAVVLKYAWS